MQTVRLPLLRGALFIIALAAIAIIMARGDNPAAATSFEPVNSVRVSDPTPGANADIIIDFSLEGPDAFPNLRTNPSVQFLPRSWGIHTDAPIGSIAGTFIALSTLGLFGMEPCIYRIPVPFTMIDASTDTSRTTSALDLGGDYHPGGPGYSGQFVDDPDTIQPPGDLGLPLVNFNDDERHNSYPWGFTSYISDDVYKDVDGSGNITVGDIRLTDVGNPGDLYYEPAGTEVQENDFEFSGFVHTRQLYLFKSWEKHAENVAANGQYDPGEFFYKDVDGSGTVSYGDIRYFRFGQLPPDSQVKSFALSAGVTRYPDFLNQLFQMFGVVGDPLARQFAQRSVLGSPVSLNIVTFRPGQLPGYPAALGYPNVVVVLNPVAPVDVSIINLTSDLCSPLSLTSTNFGISQDNPATVADEGGYARLTNPKAEKGEGSKPYVFTLVTASQPDADDDGIENMLDTCPFDPNTQDLDGRNNGNVDHPSPEDPEVDGLDGACDPHPLERSPRLWFVFADEDQDFYGNRADSCPTVSNGIQVLERQAVRLRDLVFPIVIAGDLIGRDNQADTDLDDIGDACEGAERAAQCANDLDDDGDGAVNDGCPRWGDTAAETGDQCANATDDDGDGKVNDGCPQFPLDPRETGDQCLNAVDDDGDGWINDGCPRVGESWQGEWQCADALDNDGDGYVNDGCFQKPERVSEWQCSDALDNDGDGYVNDGCRAVFKLGTVEIGTQCDNAVDDDADGLVNDGCPAVDPGDVAKTTITGHMHTVTLTQAVTIARHGVKLDDLDGKEKVASGGAAVYSVAVENKAGSDYSEVAQVGLKVAGGCGTVNGVAGQNSATLSLNPDQTKTASFTVDWSGCDDGEYIVQADACHGDDADAGLFGVGPCSGVPDGLVDTNTLDDAPRSLTVEVGP